MKATIIHQRRANKDAPWEDLGGSGLNNLKAGDAAKIDLKADQTRALYDHLRALYRIGVDGIKPGKVVVATVGEEELLKVETDRARIIQKLLDAEHGDEVWKALASEKPVLANQIALAHVYEQRKAVVEEIGTNISQSLGEEYWQKLLANNRWIFGNSYIAQVGERRIDIKAAMDHPLIAEDGCLEIVEIKKPETPFWYLKSGKTFLYRDKYPLPHGELQGAIAQASGYIFAAEKQVDSLDWKKHHDGVRPVKPRALVVHGRSVDWGEDETEAFRLLNDRHHGVTVITFDHLLLRAKQTLAVFTPKGMDLSYLKAA